MREEVERPERLVDINALPMAGIRAEGPDLVIGALARMADVAAHPETLRLQPLIAESLIEGASPPLRNMASIGGNLLQRVRRSEEHTSELQSLMRISYAVFCLKHKTTTITTQNQILTSTTR